MTLPAHVAGGYLAFKAVTTISPEFGLNEPKIFLVTILGSILPDIDVFFYKEMKEHHNSLLHTPLFWIFIFILGYGVSLLTKNPSIKNITFALSFGVFSHFFLDWFSARRSGIRIFYPFSQKMYSLFPLNQGKWGSPFTFFPKKEQVEFYVKNKFLFLTEILLTLGALGIWILEGIFAQGSR